jgi:hypothetical protein
MEVSGQLHAPAALPPGKILWYPLDRRLGRPQRNIIFPLFLRDKLGYINFRSVLVPSFISKPTEVWSLWIAESVCMKINACAFLEGQLFIIHITEV